MTRPDRLSPVEWASATLVVTIWGLNFVAAKTALATLPPFLLMSIRFACTALVLAPFFRPTRAQLPGTLLIALLLGVGHFGLMFFGVAGMDAATAAIVIELSIPFSAILAWAFFGETLGTWRSLGLAVSFIGVALLAGEPHLPRFSPFIAVVASGFAWALANVVIKRLGPINPLALNGWMAMLATPMLAGLSLATESGQVEALAATGLRGWSGVAYTIVCSTLIAYTLWYRLIARHPMNRVVPFTLLGPVVGLTGGVLLLGEPLTWHKLVGGTLTVLGVAVVELLPGRAIHRPDEPEPGT
ncbi:EamA family transporter [Magnetospirillum sp. 15-1]|uniref:DMT family transporter n=1 Tax=Magnetospirillum sp. 15-1 TaxID=1979370 RepID=UPI000BBB9AB6|nr:EamA family transporter [Magnetospirillum sp. 15-1]